MSISSNLGSARVPDSLVGCKSTLDVLWIGIKHKERHFVKTVLGKRYYSWIKRFLNSKTEKFLWYIQCG